MIHLLTADRDEISGQLFNVGSDSENYQIVELANVIREEVNPNSEIEWYGDPDHRSYKVGFSKIRDVAGWTPKRTVRDGAREIYIALEQGIIKKDEQTITLEWYKKLVEDGVVI